MRVVSLNLKKPKIRKIYTVYDEGEEIVQFSTSSLIFASLKFVKFTPSKMREKK